jgi:hypothetical protein
VQDNDRWRAYKDEEDRLANRWRVLGSSVMVLGMIAILAIGGETGSRDAGIFVILAPIVGYWLYLRDWRRVSRNFYPPKTPVSGP